MTRTLQLNRLFISLGVPFLIILVLIVLTKTTLFSQNQSLGSFAITFDLLITIPTIYYLLIRKSTIPITTVVPVLIIGLIVGSYILPIKNQNHLNLFKLWGLPLVELFVLTYIILKIRSTIRSFRHKKETNPDFFTTLKGSCRELIPEKLVPFFATEIAVLYYGFLKWKSVKQKQNDFTYHKTSGTQALLIVIIFLVLIEAFVIHLLLVNWSSTFAWFLSGLSIYSTLQLFGFLKSLSQRPISITNDHLIIRYGILAETKIELKDIVSIELSSNDVTLDNFTKKLSTFGELESHNVILKLNKEYSLSGLYGIQKKFTNLVLHIDEKEDFKLKLEALLR